MTEFAIGSVVIIFLVVGMTAALLAARRRLVPQEQLVVTVNGGRTITTSRGEKLLGVLHGAGIGIPAACGGSGTCGLCRVTVTGAGAGEAQATEKGILSPAERKANTRLACQVNLRGPAEVTVPAEMLSVESFSCEVLSNRMLAPLIRELVLEIPADKAIEFRAGGFMQLTAPAYELDLSSVEVPDAFEDEWQIAGWHKLKAASARPVTRAYSIASRPQDRGLLVFNIRLAVPPAGREADMAPGVVSSYLFSLRKGDRLDVSGPFGEFHVQPTKREMIFIGGGVGMAPLRAMIHEQIALNSGRKMSFFYGARSAADLFYHDEFETIAKEHAEFTWVPALSDPAPGDRWTGATGFIHETVRSVLRKHPAPEDCEYYLCGPPVMIAAVLRMLDGFGVERHSIFNDDFGA